MKKGPGFKAVAKKIAAKQGVSKERAGAILAAGARKASPAAIKANPNLKKVSGMKKTLTSKQDKIATAAAPKNKITGADFKKLKKK